MIHNAGYVLPGLLLFVALVLGPFLLAAGDFYRPPALAPPAAEKGAFCVENRAAMAAGHMLLLADWRDAAVRRNTREYLASDGRIWAVSLEKTCFSCHTRKSGFCDPCHAANLAHPSCWGCHVAPEAPG